MEYRLHGVSSLRSTVSTEYRLYGVPSLRSTVSTEYRLYGVPSLRSTVSTEYRRQHSGLVAFCVNCCHFTRIFLPLKENSFNALSSIACAHCTSCMFIFSYTRMFRYGTCANAHEYQTCLHYMYNCTYNYYNT